jgi:hypothetical protein
MSATSIDYDGLMQANLARVFGERDASRRMKAITELYADDAILYEPPDASATGHAAINQAVEALLANLPPNFVFTAIGAAVGHHGMGRLRWRSGPPNGPAAVTGMDVAQFEGAHAQMQVVAQAVEATGGLDDAGLSAYARGANFDTVMGGIRFGMNGEWAEPRVLQVQFQGIAGHDVEQFRNGSRQIVVSPPSFTSGGFRFPYTEALLAE